MLKEIKERYSLRQYSDKQITKKQLHKLLESAMRAPSACNYQPWHFIAIQNKKVLNDIKDFALYTKMLGKASAAIVILADTSKTKEEFCYTDTAAAAMSILLEAVHMGFGGCWCAISPQQEGVEKYREYFKLPKKMLPCLVISLGYPIETKIPENRFDENKISWYE